MNEQTMIQQVAGLIISVGCAVPVGCALAWMVYAAFKLFSSR